MRRPVSTRQWAVGMIAAAAGLVMALSLGSSPADAHALPVSSEPGDGAQLDSAPSELVISFTEPPELSVSRVDLFDAAGETHPVGELTTVPGDSRSLLIPVEPLPEGAYTVSWRVVSKVDGHPTAGAFAFGLGVPAAPIAADVTTETDAPALSLQETAGRLLLFAGLVPLIGVVAVVPFALGTFGGAHRRLAAGSWVLAVIGLVLLALAQSRATNAGFRTFLDTPAGQATIWRTLALAAAGVGVMLLLTADRVVYRVGLSLTGLAAAGAAAAHVAAGHAAGAATPALDVTSQWVHVVAIGVWIGGLAALIVGLPGLTRPERGPAARRFSLLAGYAVVVVAATGTLRAVSELDSWGSLFSSGYGRGIIAKVVGIGVLVTMGAVNRYRNVPRAAAPAASLSAAVATPQPSTSVSGLLRLGRVELAVSAFVLAAAAIVASLSPPSPGAAAAPPPSVTVSGADAGTSVRAELTVDPGTPGTNELSLGLADYDSDEPFADADVSLRFAFLDDPAVGESTLSLDETRPGTYAATGSNLSLEGTWQVTAVVERGVDSVEVPLDELELGAAAEDHEDHDMEEHDPSESEM
jgi:copper transport protein